VFPGVRSLEDGSKIRFKNITSVYYFKHTHVFVAESVLKESFSELVVFGDGEFDLTLNIPINYYSNSYAKVQEAKEKNYKQ
jgi:hypothetical protein